MKLIRQHLTDKKNIRQSYSILKNCFMRLRRVIRDESRQRSNLETKIFGKRFVLTDPRWDMQTYKSIFEEEQYKFIAKNLAPVILDCGANVGFSSLYFSKLYPNAKIIAFEPDNVVFNALVKNISSFNLTNVELINKAVWVCETDIGFLSDHGVGGKIVASDETDNVDRIKTVRLRDYLQRKVDLLKIDIEGAEYEVLMDSKDRLYNVDHLFFEYHSKVGSPQRLHELLQVISDVGFRYFLKDAYTKKHPFLKAECFNRTYDLQLNVFCYR